MTVMQKNDQHTSLMNRRIKMICCAAAVTTDDITNFIKKIKIKGGQIVADLEWFQFSVAGIQAATDKQFRFKNKSHCTGQ